MALYAVLPMKRNSYGELNSDGLTWKDDKHNTEWATLPVIAKKAYFSLPDNELPDTGEPYGCAWSQHLGTVTYFTPGSTIASAWTTTYIQFGSNFVGQRVQVVIANSEGVNTIMHPYEIIALNGSTAQPILQDSRTMQFKVGVNYWVEVWFETTVNKAPGFYGTDGIEGFYAKYYWAINEQPVSSPYQAALPTDLSGTIV